MQRYPETSAVEDNYVRIMCDFGAFGVWSRRGAFMPSGLPATPELRDRLHAWADDYETQDIYLDDGGWSLDRWAAFSEEGRRIAQEVKRQLPDWTVVYFDEGAYKRIQVTGQEAEDTEYEYEISLDPGPTVEAGPSRHA